MKLSPQEKAEHRAAFRQMSPAKKLDHIVTYYKIPIVLVLCGLFVLGEVSYRQLTKREPLLYGAYMNVTVGEELDQALRPGHAEPPIRLRLPDEAAGHHPGPGDRSGADESGGL